MSHEAGPTGEKRVVMSSFFPGTPEGVRSALDALKSGLLALGAGDEEAFSAELVVAEALNNVVEHALSGVAEPAFQLSLSHAPRGVFIDIRDRGQPMPDGRPPIGAAPDVAAEVEDLPEGGFGWFLIRELARDLDYRRTAGENRLTFRMAICVAEAA